MRALVGRNVRRLRKRTGLTQEQFAELSGFSQQSISSLEKGTRNPTVITLYELSAALGVSHMDLVRPAKGPPDGGSANAKELTRRTSPSRVTSSATPTNTYRGISRRREA